MSKITVHERFVCGTSVLNDYIIELGFELSSDTGHNIGRVRIYTLQNKKIIDSHHRVTLQTIFKDPKKKPIIEYQGYTVGKDLLTFFAKRQLINIKDETNI